MAWIELCASWDQGGLNIHELLAWNKTVMLKCLGDVLNRQGSFWEQWIRAYKLRGTTLWDIQEKMNDSYHWKCLLRLRDEVLLKMPRHDFHTLLEGTDVDFEYMYRMFWAETPCVGWHIWVCQSPSPPKVAFINWLFVKDLLYTMDRIALFHPEVSMTCVLYHNASETRDHLFFDCEFSTCVLHTVMCRVGLQTMCRGYSEWLQVLANAQHPNSLIFKLRATAFSMVIYWVWRHRNQVRYAHDQCSSDQCIFQVLRMLKTRWKSMTLVRSRNVLEIERLLFL